MRLSEDRINAIAYKVAFELVKKRCVKTTHRLNQVTAWVEKPIFDYLRAEDEIDEIIRRDMANMTTCPPEGSFEYQALFQKKKEDYARKRGYQL
ncbi:MAG: DUF507 family protein [Candidatus Sumerlaeia bacterium]